MKFYKIYLFLINLFTNQENYLNFFDTLTAVTGR